MRLIKINELVKSRILLLTIFVLLFYLTRVPRLDSDIINPDGVNWHFRSEQFVVALKQCIFENTYQHYHPGVTLMWITGIPIEVFKQLTQVKLYSQFSFPAFDFIAKFMLINVHLVLSLLLIYFLTRVVHFNKAVLVVTALTLEPFFAGNSRLYHLDVLLTLLLFLGLVLLWKVFLSGKYVFTVLAAFVLSMAFLTKSVGIGACVFALGFLLSLGFKKSKLFYKHAGVFLLVYVVSTFVFFPALWVKPVDTLSGIFSEAERIGARDGHGQIVLGEYTRDAGPWFYPVVLLMKLSPFTLVGLVLFLVFYLRKKSSIDDKKFSIYLGVFYLVYFLGMTFLSKKLDRYMLVMYPFFCYLSVAGYIKMFNFLKERNKSVLVPITATLGLCCITVLLPLFTLFPYYFTYTSPLFGSPVRANSIIAQKPFGVGMYDLKRFIIEKYGYYPKLGFIDIKPMKAIYPNSLIFDIRVQKPKDANLVVLGINEDFVEKSASVKEQFMLDSVVQINGLDYWRIFKQK